MFLPEGTAIMENEMQQSSPQMTDRQILEEIYKDTQKTKNYMKWQLIITIALVVVPLLATVAIIPFALSSLSSIYSGGLDLNSAVDIGSSLLQ